MKIDNSETEIIEIWSFDGHNITANEQGKRIDWLINNYLTRIASDSSGWIVLYQDPEDKRYWEKDNPQGHLQSGGPRTLKTLSDNEAKIKYNL
jgi:hypothetical protein